MLMEHARCGASTHRPELRAQSEHRSQQARGRRLATQGAQATQRGENHQDACQPGRCKPALVKAASTPSASPCGCPCMGQSAMCNSPPSLFLAASTLAALMRPPTSFSNRQLYYLTEQRHQPARPHTPQLLLPSVTPNSLLDTQKSRNSQA